MASSSKATLLAHAVSLPCACGEQIYLPLSSVLQCKPAACGACGARLTLNPAKNATALAALDRLVDKLQVVEVDDVRAR